MLRITENSRGKSIEWIDLGVELDAPASWLPRPMPKLQAEIAEELRLAAKAANRRETMKSLKTRLLADWCYAGNQNGFKRALTACGIDLNLGKRASWDTIAVLTSDALCCPVELPLIEIVEAEIVEEDEEEIAAPDNVIYLKEVRFLPPAREEEIAAKQTEEVPVKMPEIKIPDWNENRGIEDYYVVGDWVLTPAGKSAKIIEMKGEVATLQTLDTQKKYRITKLRHVMMAKAQAVQDLIERNLAA